MTKPSFHQHLTAWKFAVAGKSHSPLPIEIVATSLEEFQNWQAQLQSTKIEAEKAGYTCQFNKGGSASGRMAAWITSGGFTLKIAFTAKARTAKHTNVTQTSKQAFYSTDFSTQEGKVAQIIMAKTGEDITRAEIAYILGIQEGRVSGRVNSLLKKYRDGGFKYGDGEYRLALTSPRLSRCPGASDKLNESLRFVKVESAPMPVQTEMF